MPTLTQYLRLGFVNLAFLAQIVAMVYFKSVLDVRENWPLYRCNPPYWIFSENVAEDFTYCVQNTQTNMMGYLLQPMQYMVSSLTAVGGDLADSLNNIRQLVSTVRNFVADIVQQVFGVFLNLIVEFQKIVLSIKDTVGKMVGIVVTILYVLDGSIKTMNSAWSGPPGQMVRAMGSCFHPRTPLRLKNGRTVAMEDVAPGTELCAQSEQLGAPGGPNARVKVFAVLRVDNAKREPLFRLRGRDSKSRSDDGRDLAQTPTTPGANDDVLVTGEHWVWHAGRWMQVRDCPLAEPTDIVLPYFACLITTNRRIVLGDWVFWDWEDDELAAQQKAPLRT